MGWKSTSGEEFSVCLLCVWCFLFVCCLIFFQSMCVNAHVKPGYYAVVNSLSQGAEPCRLIGTRVCAIQVPMKANNQ